MALGQRLFYLSILVLNQLAITLKSQRHIHFIGIGGIGMSALAMILSNRGHIISGSDTRYSLIIQRLEDAGIKIFTEQTGENIKSICTKRQNSPLIVISSAISKENPELKTAEKKQLQIWHRSDLLAALIADQPSIAVTGTHGKTTTSTFITTMLTEAGEDPTALIGGLVPCYSSNAHSGQGALLIAEADESDGTLIKFQAALGVITNLELDHTDHYSSLEQIIDTMKEFNHGCDGLLANYDCNILREHISPSAWWSVKTHENVNFAAIPIHLEGNETTAKLYEDSKYIETITLQVPGIHNLSNAIAAYASCRLMGVSKIKLINAISCLKTPLRRFEFRGTWEKRLIVDDYAHHPSEIKATLTMAKLMIKTGKSSLPSTPKRIIAVFQPHRFSRVKQFLKEFIEALATSDLIIIAPIYGAGEKPIEGINSNKIAKEAKKIYQDIPILVGEDMNEITQLIKDKSRPEDLILAMGAGDINSLWKLLIQVDNKEKSLTT